MKSDASSSSVRDRGGNTASDPARQCGQDQVVVHHETTDSPVSSFNSHRTVTRPDISHRIKQWSFTRPSQRIWNCTPTIADVLTLLLHIVTFRVLLACCLSSSSVAIAIASCTCVPPQVLVGPGHGHDETAPTPMAAAGDGRLAMI